MVLWRQQKAAVQLQGGQVRCEVMAADLRVELEPGMIVTVLGAPGLAEPLAHQLVRQLLRHALAHPHDPVPQHFADGLVLPKSAHLVYSTQVPEESFGSVEQGLIFRTHHNVGDIPVAPVGIQQEPLPEGQGEGRDCQEVLVIAHQQRRDRERLRRFLRAFIGEKTNKEKMLKYLV